MQLNLCAPKYHIHAAVITTKSVDYSPRRYQRWPSWCHDLATLRDGGAATLFSRARVSNRGRCSSVCRALHPASAAGHRISTYSAAQPVPPANAVETAGRGAANGRSARCHTPWSRGLRWRPHCRQHCLRISGPMSASIKYGFILSLRRPRTLEAIRTMCRMMQEFFNHAAGGIN